MNKSQFVSQVSDHSHAPVQVVESLTSTYHDGKSFEVQVASTGYRYENNLWTVMFNGTTVTGSTSESLNKVWERFCTQYKADQDAMDRDRRLAQGY
jgi:archaellum component FlaF (FlaF/FlaG flagellin family)